MADNAFGDLDAAFAGAEAKAGAMEKLLPEGIARFAIVPFDAKDNGQLVEHDIFKANSGTTGIKFQVEVLEPAAGNDANGNEVKMAGEILEKVFWISAANLPYVKNDLEQILQAEIPAGQKLSETIEGNTWAGRTFEATLSNRKDNKGVMRNEISFITKWSPEAPEAKKEAAKTETKKETAPAGGKKQTKF